MRAAHPPLLDTESFSNLFTRTQLIIYRFIFGLHGGPADEVEDLTSETYMRAWKGRHRFIGSDEDALCWLFTIARNLVIDDHRKNQTHPDNNAELLDDTSLVIILPSSQQYLKKQLYGTIRHLWRMLKDAR
jgi:RNA polymerase sigma-70 factor (ECF subfamily)